VAPDSGPEDACSWAFEKLERRGLPKASVVDHRSGVQSEVVIIGASNREGQQLRFALKVFRPRYRRGGMVEKEYSSLQSFHRGLSGRPGIDCPEPLCLSPDRGAYLMTFVEGVPFDEFVAGKTRPFPQTASQVLRGLTVYYDNVGEQYGDFQPSNVLVGGKGVVFLDPTVPNPANPAYAASAIHPKYAPSSVDVGFWLHSVAVHTPKSVLRGLRVARGQRDFAVELLTQAAAAAPEGEAAAYVAEVTRVVRGHLDWLRDDGGWRDGLLSVFGARFVSSLTRAERKTRAADSV
jgi:hypothetical protein